MMDLQTKEFLSFFGLFLVTSEREVFGSSRGLNHEANGVGGGKETVAPAKSNDRKVNCTLATCYQSH